MSYKDIVDQDKRLAILQVLQQDADYAHNEHVIGRLLGALGHAVSSDRLRTELSWLAEQGLVTISDVSELRIAKLTRRGADVALGHAQCPGVARPRPGM